MNHTSIIIICGLFGAAGPAALLIGAFDRWRERRDIAELQRLSREAYAYAYAEHTHLCEHCHLNFQIRRHTRWYEDIGGITTLVRTEGSGYNMIYLGSMNREYAKCPHCGMVESQISAECRDQGDAI